jgi:hypothetical protein
MNEYGALVEWYWQSETSTWKYLFQYNLAHHKYHMDQPGIEPVHQKWEASDEVPQLLQIQVYCTQMH